MSQTTSVVCAACGTLNEVWFETKASTSKMKYAAAALQFACRACGAALPLDNDREKGEPQPASQKMPEP